VPSAAVIAVGLATPWPWKARVTGTPPTGWPVAMSLTVPVSTPVFTLFGGVLLSAAGAESSPPRDPA
jgi:hypothetical protein